MAHAQATFQRFESSYHDLGKSLSRHISNIPSARGDDLAREIRSAEADVAAMGALINQIDRDMAQFPFHLKTKYDPLVRRLKAAFNGQQQDLKRVTDSQRHRSPVDQQRAQILSNRASSNRIDESLTGIMRTNAESEEIGASVAVRLREQREQLLRARDDIDSVDVVVNQAKTIMSRMGNSCYCWEGLGRRVTPIRSSCCHRQADSGFDHHPGAGHYRRHRLHEMATTVLTSDRTQTFTFRLNIRGHCTGPVPSLRSMMR